MCCWAVLLVGEDGHRQVAFLWLVVGWGLFCLFTASSATTA